jgi:hypothetical protein
VGSDLAAFGPILPVDGRSGVVLYLLRHYRLRLTAGLEENGLVSVLDGVKRFGNEVE